MAKCEVKDVHHCPVEGCIYAFGSARYFSSKKLLNQHKGKVHAEKKYTCSKCQKGFGTNWLKEHHELMCGKAWICCTCKQSYCSRESLLSHARRKEHDVAEEDKKPPKTSLSKAKKKLHYQPLVFLIQPVIQSNVDLALSRTKQNNRIILPKIFIPYQMSVFPPAEPIQPVPADKEVSLSAPAIIKPNAAEAPCPSPIVNTVTPVMVKEPTKSERKQRFPRSVAETQTCGELDSSRIQISRTLESRGSQSYAQGMKRGVGIESTHTQTTESSVHQIKKKSGGHRSRRKSVAVTTDAQVMQPTQSLWSNLEEFMFPKIEKVFSLKANRSSGTQTNPNPSFPNAAKEMRDSQTLTDLDLFPFQLPANETTDDHPYLLPCSVSDASIQLVSEKNSEVDQQKDCSSIVAPALELLDNVDLWDSSENSRKYDTLLASILGDCNDSTVCNSTMNGQENSLNLNMPSTLDDLNKILDPILDESDVFSNPAESPEFLHTQTQTNLPCDMDYTSYLANMETQTNDDLLFSDLEFFDTETQTPWEDIPNFSDELQVDQLSIEIQTDFSLMSSLVHHKSADAVSTAHMETQTLDLAQTPQLTNSEAQTLIASFYSLT